MKNILIIFLIISGYFMNSYSQDIKGRFAAYGEIVKIKMDNAAFPHPQREKGYTYKDKVYTAEANYSNNSVGFFIPKNYVQTEKTNLVIHFHGWGNNIDSTFAQYNLVDQFCRSGKNAILVIPEGATNVPDSFGGKLEDKGTFKLFIEEALNKLVDLKKIKTNQVGDIIISGHSGGYRVMSYILMQGGMPDKIKEIWLFDALYGQTEKFCYWVDHFKGKLINIYTTDGGTKFESERMMECFKGWEIPFISKTEKEITAADLQNNKNIFIYSDLTHNGVILDRDEFFQYLKASCLVNEL